MTDEQKKHIEKLALKDEIVRVFLDEYNALTEDAEKAFYTESSEMTKALAKEMNMIRNGNIGGATIFGSEDKLFERIKSLLTDSEKIFTGLRKGKHGFAPEESSDERSFIDKQADKKRKASLNGDNK